MDMSEEIEETDFENNDQQPMQEKSLFQASGYLGIFSILILAITLALIAGTIVLALIPVYLKTKDRPSTINSSTNTYALTYGTSMNGLNGLTITNQNDLSSSLDNTFQLTGLSVTTGRFVGSTSSSGKKKRQTTTISANSVTCQNSAGNTGDYLYLEVTASYPSGCTSSGCHNKYDKQLTQLFSVTHTQFTLSITLSNGTTLNIVLNFCSLNQFIVNLNCSNGTSQSSNLATATLPITLAQFVSVVGSFLNDSWYTSPGPLTIGPDNQVGSIRTFLDSTGTKIYNETLLLYVLNSTYFEQKWKGPGDNGASIDFGVFVLGSYVERLTGTSICSGSAMIINFGSDFCGTNLPTAVNILTGVHAYGIQQIQTLLNVSTVNSCS